MVSESKKKDIMMLLADYMNFLPGGTQEPFAPVTGGFSSAGSWPLTEESMRRMDTTSYVGQTYQSLDKALRLLSQKYPHLYSAILQIYLREEVGHRDYDRIKVLAANGNIYAKSLKSHHDSAINILAELLEEVDLYVEHPHKATGPKPGKDIKAAHDELFAIFNRYFEEGQSYKQARDNAVLKMTDLDGKEYYSKRHADRILKARLNSDGI